MRSYLEFTVDLKPFDAVSRILSHPDYKEELAFQDYKVASGKDEDAKAVAILVFEKYFFRNNSTATLTVTVSDFEGDTTVKCISTGNGDGVFDIGWWAGKSFIKPLRKILDPYILEMKQEP
ncbi:hypothetical protein FZC79_18330 [Rossellomorea vietnamensis]|uniref:Uncharacterized protein n=1 Tax=Rossellomorea vietnamensis TaxID=218284 RepID=A0A5D4KBU3_9BACI|nr:DUF6054 family protein [Rossellomorea vietnamensis]TYR73593.1 hypothetical protein FZC79_18330 [Rossellomorea vietnamensis]